LLLLKSIPKSKAIAAASSLEKDLTLVAERLFLKQ
jgi:hypothetical protein